MLGFHEAIGEALRRIRTGGLPHEEIPEVFDQIEAADELREAALAGLEARVYQQLDADRERERRSAEAGDVIPCRQPDCGAGVVRIERYKTTVGWEKQEDGSWSLGAHDTGTHFHLFCTEGHESKCWGQELPEGLKRVVYPEERR